MTYLQDLVDKLQPLSLEFQKDKLPVCHMPRKVEQTKSVIDALHDVPRPALTCILRELNLNDNNELIFKDAVFEKQVGWGALEIEHCPEGYEKHYGEFLEEIIDAILSYLNKRDSEFSKQPLLQIVKIFDTSSWPSTFCGTKELRTWGNEDSNLASYYEENQ